MSYSFGKSIVTDGLVFYVDAGNGLSYPGSGTTWTDLVGSVSLSENGNPTHNSSNGGYFVYDGTDDWHNGTGSLSGAEITVECWFKLNTLSSPTRQSLFSSITTTDSDRRFLLNLESDEKPRVVFWTNDSADTTDLVILKSSSTTVSAGTWYHLAGTYDSTNGSKLYVNGSLDSSSSTVLSAALGSGANIRVGARALSSPDVLVNGNISSCKAYNRVLSAAEIAQNYNALKNRFV